MPIFRRHQRACESSDGPPLYHIQVTNACVCTLLHAFSLRITTSSIKNVHRNLLFLLPPNIWGAPLHVCLVNANHKYNRRASITPLESVQVCVSVSASKQWGFFVKHRSHWRHKTFELTFDGANRVLAVFVLCVWVFVFFCFCLHLPGDFSVNDPYSRCQSVIYATYNALHWLAIEL